MLLSPKALPLFAMECPACHAANVDHAKFCQNCGAALSSIQRCVGCQAELPADARFCLQCGQAVAGVTPVDETRLARLAAAAPQPLADKMRAAHIRGERKIVTCLFADVVGSTQLAEGLDPDDWAEIMNQAFDRLSPAIYRYEGTIARLMGDALLAFFGAPVAHEDDPERAVRAALELIQAAQAYAADVQRTHGFQFAIRVGLNTGPVVVGDVGSDLKFEYTAMGDAVNLAARMQTAARPLTVLISEHTYRFVAPIFEVADLGPLLVKGKAEPVKVYEVLRPKADRGPQRGLAAAGLSSPLVGRELELAALTAASDPPRGGLTIIVGEAGIGKTRLVAEWRAALQAQSGRDSWQWSEGHCLSYGQRLPYHLAMDWLQNVIGARTPSPLLELQRFLEALGQHPLYAGLGHLLLPQADDPIIAEVNSLDPQALQARYLDSLRALLMALADRQPQVIVLDDLHWADPSSIDLLSQLLPLAASLPIRFGFVSRADSSVPGWRLITQTRAMKVGVIDLTLARLSEADNNRLVANLLKLPTLPVGLQTLVLQKSEGNPLFVEEVIRTLIERGILVQQSSGWAANPETVGVAIPDNLQGLLLARIDRLTDSDRRTLRIAAVIGRQFSLAVLAAVLGQTPDLRLLEAAGLVSVDPAASIGLFRHALIQDAAYSSLVKQDRRSLHRLVGEALEGLYPDQRTSRELAAIIGDHFRAAGDAARAHTYLTLAAEAAARVYANAEAIAHYTEALALKPENAAVQFNLTLARLKLFHLVADRPAQALDLETLKALAEKSDNADWRATTALQHSKLARAIGDYPTAIAQATQAAAQAKSVDAKATEAEAHLDLGRAHWHYAEYSLARARAAEALRLSQDSNLVEVQAGAMRLLGMIADVQSDYTTARSHFEQSLAQFGRIGDRRGEGMCLNSLGVVALHQGDLESAHAYCNQALSIKHELGDRHGEGVVLNNLGTIARQHSDLTGTQYYFETCAQLCRDIDDQEGLAAALNGLGSAAAYLGDYAAGQSFLEQALNLSREIGDRDGELSVLEELSQLNYEMGNFETAGELDHLALVIAGELGARLQQATSYCRLGYTLTELGQWEAASAAFQQALTLLRKWGQPGRATEALAGLAQLAMRRDDLEGAFQYIEAIFEFSESKVTRQGDLPPRQALVVYDVLRAANDPRAGKVLENAGRLLQTEVDRLGDPARQRSFVEHVPYRRRLMSEWQKHQMN